MARSLPSLVGEMRHNSLSIFLIHVKIDKRVLILSCLYQYFNETAFVPTQNSLFLDSLLNRECMMLVKCSMLTCKLNTRRP